MSASLQAAASPRAGILSSSWQVFRDVAGTEGPNLLFVVRTLLAACIALFVAFTLQLQSPLSAVTTVVIVAAPVNGAIVSKSIWRLIGTLIGAAAAVVLMAWFAQSPVLFTAVLSLCIGVACFASSLLRFFKAYGTVLAGYTIIIVSSGAFSDPDSIFIGALSRVSAVSTGLASAALVFLITVLPQPSKLLRTMEQLLRDVAAGFVQFRRPEGHVELSTAPRTALLARATALDELIEYGAAESYEIRRRKPLLRLAGARILGLLSVLQPLHDKMTDDPEAIEARRLAHEMMRRLAEDGEPLGTLLPAIDEARQTLDRIARNAADPRALVVALHERNLLDQLRGTIEALLSRPGLRGYRPVRLRSFLEWQAALRNGVRGALVTFIAGLFWYVSQWPSGPSLLAYLVPASCLLATSPSASRASVSFARGTLAAVPVALLCQIFLLPQVDGFPLLAFSLCVCLAPGIWMQTRPAYRLSATGYTVFFNAMISVHNPITFNDIALLNNLSTFVVGAGLLVVVFRVLLPADPRREARRLLRSIVRATERATRRIPRPDSVERWQNQQMQKVLRLVQRLGEMPDIDGVPVVRAAYVVTALGRAAMTLRAIRRDPALPAEAGAPLDAALEALHRVSRSPASVAAQLARTEEQLAATLDADGPAQHMVRQAIGLLGEAVLLTGKASDVLNRACPALPQRL